MKFVVNIEFEVEQAGQERDGVRFFAFDDFESANQEYLKWLGYVWRDAPVRTPGGLVDIVNCRLYESTAADPRDAQEQIKQGHGKCLRDAKDPTVEDPDLWNNLLASLEPEP